LKKITQRKPHYFGNNRNRAYLVEIPWPETSGSPSSPYAWNNGAHASVHSIIAALRCNKKEDALYWLATACEQLTGACSDLTKPGAKMVPAPEKEAA